ncbi:hypothetical protein JYT83_00070 [bacterium AH-315-F18]|nr:hypothetical protein [bacterium AH-315-F18]
MSTPTQNVDVRPGSKTKTLRARPTIKLFPDALKELRFKYGLLPNCGFNVTTDDDNLTANEALGFFNLRPGQFQALRSICYQLGATQMASFKLIAAMDAKRADEFIQEHLVLLESPARRATSTLRRAG